MPVKELYLSKEAAVIAKAQKVLRAINHPLRRKILETINNADKKIISVTEIYVLLRLEQSVASQHLAILRREGIVKTKRDGKYIFYTVNDSRIKEVANLCVQMNAVAE